MGFTDFRAIASIKYIKDFSEMHHGARHQKIIFELKLRPLLARVRYTDFCQLQNHSLYLLVNKNHNFQKPKISLILIFYEEKNIQF